MIKLKIRGITISHTSYKKRQRDEEEREVEKYIQKKTEAYEISRDEKYKFEIDIFQSKLQYIREIKIRGIVTCAKAKWRTEGEKCSIYFLQFGKKTLYRTDYSKINFTRRNRKKQTSLIFLANSNPLINIYIAQQIQ